MKFSQSALLVALFAGSSQAFSPATPLKNVPSNTANNNGAASSWTMRLANADLPRRQNLKKVLKEYYTNPSDKAKEIVETRYLSDDTGALLEKSHWKLRRTMLQKIRRAAYDQGVEVDPSFGVPLTQQELEAKERAEGQARRQERAAYYNKLNQGRDERVAKRAELEARQKEEAEKAAIARAARIQKAKEEAEAEAARIAAEKKAEEERIAAEAAAKKAEEERLAAEAAAKKAEEERLAAEAAAKKAEEEAAAAKKAEEEAIAAKKAEEEAAASSAAKEETAAKPAAAVTPKTIKALRDQTGAGMMDCKKALLETDGDAEAAAEFLRKKGLAKADKKASRVAAEGKIAIGTNDNKVVLVEVNCETDFVGKDSNFLGFCDQVASAAVGVEGDSLEALMETKVDGGATVEESRQAMVAKIGENIQVRRMVSRGSESTTTGAYVHMNRIGVVVELEGGDEQLCTDIAMHVAAMNPPYATPDDVPQDVLDKERKILSEQALESGKPPQIVEKMVEGRIRKYLQEICLVSQQYVRDGDKTVQQLLDANGAKMIGFTRVAVGEGIEKKEDDFAAEVAKMAGQAPAEEAAAPEPEPAAEAPEEPKMAPAQAVTPKLIKQLRDSTGAGMMDCKKALLETNGDMEAAAEFLRKKGLAKADKKASRVAAEGKIAVAQEGGKAVMVEINCETDFVGKDSNFLEFCDQVASAAVGVDGDSLDALMESQVDGGTTVEETRQAMVAKIGENIQVRRLASRGSESTTTGAYVHMNRIGVVVEVEGGDEQLCTDIAMHVAAMNPPYATPDDVPQDVLDKERKILSEQALESGKPPEIVEKMVEGRIRKYLQEICLVSQQYVRDGDKTVQQLLDANGAKMIGFTRLAVGEGIEKKEDDFAAEVAKMAGQA